MRRLFLALALLAVSVLSVQAQQVRSTGVGGVGGINGVGALPDYGSGCTLSRSAATTVGIAACATADDTTFIVMPSSGRQAAYTKTLGAWTVGTGNGCLDTGALGATKFIYMYQIQRADTGVVDYLCTITFGSPTMPTSYGRKRFIGSVPMDGAGNIVAFTQMGSYTMYAAPVLDANTVSVGTARTLQTLASVPSGYTVQSHIRTAQFKSAASPKTLFQNPNEADAAPGATAGNVDINGQVSGTGNGITLFVFTNTAQQIAIRSDTAATSVWVVTIGWNDPLINWPH